jgi:pimeloyl-ACP methyl ester carboxylesterase
LVVVLLAAIPARAEPAAPNAVLAQALATRMAHARWKCPKVGHLPHLEAPARFNELLLRFLDEAE